MINQDIKMKIKLSENIEIILNSQRTVCEVLEYAEETKRIGREHSDDPFVNERNMRYRSWSDDEVLRNATIETLLEMEAERKKERWN